MRPIFVMARACQRYQLMRGRSSQGTHSLWCNRESLAMDTSHGVHGESAEHP